MAPSRIILGLGITAGALLLQLLCCYGAALISNPAELPWVHTWQEVCEAPAKLQEAVEAAGEVSDAVAYEETEVAVIEILLQNGHPAAKTAERVLTMPELLAYLTENDLGTDARPVLFRTKERLTEEQWDSVLSPCLNQLDFFWNYAIDCPAEEEKAPTAATPPQRERVYIDISGFNGDTIIYCGSERIDEADFPAFVAELAARTPRPQICLNGQCSLPWERMRELVEICIGKGFDRADVLLSMQCGPEPQNR